MKTLKVGIMFVVIFEHAELLASMPGCWYAVAKVL